MRWLGYFIIWTLGITVVGAVLGSVVFPVAGLFFETERSASEMSVFGIKTLGFYFGIWAPGTALVLTVKKAYEANKTDSADA
ncbi:hypothetical protein [Synoicihabitans lomoniglobus]|uniref:Uncharacterized protein n=1 Tax=Synoicihabitans lomoniglobus TaxID=2909285 RepID=A0AAE9ZYC1_9BACT|nr:hypothetical protein [Opitutaceae bacterium LMO-M01]WED63433.1 hypothetical protein PXH66_13925 [Opitutaceae bacterium LMO-M01]